MIFNSGNTGNDYLGVAMIVNLGKAGKNSGCKFLVHLRQHSLPEHWKCDDDDSTTVLLRYSRGGGEGIALIQLCLAIQLLPMSALLLCLSCCN